MGEKRIIVETNAATRTNLNRILKEQHKSLTEWFVDKVEEGSHSYSSELSITNPQDQDIQLKSLLDLNKTKVILKTFQSFNWAFTEDNTSYLSHNIHPYPAKYIPQIPNTIIKMLSLPGEMIWDPFGGSGTTALEALLLGRQAISSDINPIANTIGKAKTISLTKSEEEELSQLSEQMSILSKDAKSFDRIFEINKKDCETLIPGIPNIEKWFALNAIKELSFIKWTILNKLTAKAQLLGLATFSKIIIKVSFQDSETRYVSKIREVKNGSSLQLYSNELKSTIIKVKQLSSLLRYREAEFVKANLIHDDVVNDNSIDLIISSPPYPNATDYHLYHRFRIYWLGFTPKEMASSEIGSHLRHQKENTEIEQYLSEMRHCLIKMYQGLRHGRYAVLVLGDGVFKGQTFETAELLAKISKAVGFDLVGIVKRQVHETKRSFVSAARRLREEKLLILRKKDIEEIFELSQPPYKLWDYEDVLRKLEIKNLLEDRLGNNTKHFEKICINSLSVDKLRRLTFTHGFCSNTHSKEATWQAILENGDALESVRNRKDPKYITHGIHAYKGKFYPQLAKCLFNIANINPGDHVLDPFCGSGTVLLEGVLNGSITYGFDLNPVALRIANVKTKSLGLDFHLTEKLITTFIDNLSDIDETKSNLARYDEDVLIELKGWFPPPVLNKLTNILSRIDEIPNRDIAELLEVCVSSIIRDVSQQEPKDLRIRRREIPIENAPVIELLIKKVNDQLGRIMKYARNTKYCPSTLGTAKINKGDCRLWQTFDDTAIKEASIDCIITSPPYSTALPYIDTDRLSILLLFGTKSSERNQIEKSLVGAREITTSERNEANQLIEDQKFDNILSKHAISTIKIVYKSNKGSDVGFRKMNTAALLYRYYKDMSKVFINLDKVIRKKGNLFFVIGDNKTNTSLGEITIESGKALVEIGKSLGWTLVDVIPITVTQENRLHNKNGITSNDIIWFKK